MGWGEAGGEEVTPRICVLLGVANALVWAAALALWLPLPRFIELIVIMSLAGGILTLAMVVRHRWQRRLGRPEIPYGLAIVAAAAWAFSEPFFNHFGA